MSASESPKIDHWQLYYKFLFKVDQLALSQSFVVSSTASCIFPSSLKKSNQKIVIEIFIT